MTVNLTNYTSRVIPDWLGTESAQRKRYLREAEIELLALELHIGVTHGSTWAEKLEALERIKAKRLKVVDVA